MNNYCEAHEKTQEELNVCKSKINVFEALMKKIDKELSDIKNDIKQLSDKLEKLQLKTSEMPLRIMMFAVTIGAGVSTILTFIIMFIVHLLGVL